MEHHAKFVLDLFLKKAFVFKIVQQDILWKTDIAKNNKNAKIWWCKIQDNVLINVHQDLLKTLQIVPLARLDAHIVSHNLAYSAMKDSLNLKESAWANAHQVIFQI